MPATLDLQDQVPVQLFRCATVDGKVAATHDLFTTSPTPFLPMFIIVLLRQVAGFVSAPTISIGTNEAANNIISNRAIGAVDTQMEYLRIPLGTELAGGLFRGMASESSMTLKLKIETPANATTYMLETEVIGAYI